MHGENLKREPARGFALPDTAFLGIFAPWKGTRPWCCSGAGSRVSATVFEEKCQEVRGKGLAKSGYFPGTSENSTRIVHIASLVFLTAPARAEDANGPDVIGLL